ncbi:MAG: trigger factor [Candidatus Omnitrophota bacterium]
MERFKVQVKDGKACEKILAVEVGEEEIRNEFDHFYQTIAPQAKIPGFRPGRAPRDVLEMHYQREAHDHVLKHLIQESFREALQQAALDPLTQPVIQDVDFKEKKKLTYKAVIEIRPKIKLSRVKGLSAKKVKAEVKEEDVQRQLKGVQESFAKYRAAEGRGVQLGDHVIADYVCRVDQKEIDKRESDWLEMRPDHFLKGFVEGILGMQAGETRQIQASFPSDFAREDLAGKTADFSITVKEIKTKDLPALDDELAKDAGNFKSLDELIDKTRKDLQQAGDRETEAVFENALLDELCKHNKIDLPRGVVAQRIEFLLEQTRNQSMRRGMPETEFEKQKPELMKSLEVEARKQVHLAFLLDEIAQTENLRAEESDLAKKYQEMADRIRQPVDKVRQYYEEHEQAKESLKEQIRSERAVEFIKMNAKLK